MKRAHPRAFDIQMIYKDHVFQSISKLSCVEFHTKYHIHTLKDVYFIDRQMEI